MTLFKTAKIGTVLSILVIAANAFAGGTIDNVTNGGTYITYSNFCGLEVERDGTNLIMTEVDNPYAQTPCSVRGKINRFRCHDTKNSDCEKNSDVRIHILDDGNFLMLNSSKDGPSKFFLK